MTISNRSPRRQTAAVIALACALSLSGSVARAGDPEKTDATKQKTLDVAAVKSLKAPSFVVPDTGGIRMILIKPGTFTMGSPPSEVGRGDDETQHEVTISKPFYMAETETTHAQYFPIMWPEFRPILVGRGRYGYSVPELHQGGSFLTIERQRRDLSRRAMDGMTWEDAVKFGEKVTAKERAAGRLPRGYVYRLPTEAEWEYACRAGTAGPFNVKADKMLLFAVCGGFAGCNGDRFFLPPPAHGDTPQEVAGARTPNAWGLYDMHGNLYEWCHDWYGPYPKGAVTDPVGPAEPSKAKRRVARGGCFLSGQAAQYLPDVPGVAVRYLRSASRNCFRYDHQMRINGVRLVLAEEIETAGKARTPDRKGNRAPVRATEGAGAISAQPTPAIPFEAALKDADVTLKSMSSGQTESLILGNGDLYGIVWAKGGGLYMRVTKNDIWDARIDTSKDPPLPKVDVRANTVSGARRAPPSYRHPYPQPRCAAAIRLGPTGPPGAVGWTCIRRAARNELRRLPDGAGADMLVAGRAGVSNGYRGTLSRPVQASSLRLRLKGTPNASYYVNIYNEGGRAILASGWKKSPTTAQDVSFAFPAQRIGRLEVYARTSDGKAATNRLSALVLSAGDRKTPLTFPPAADVHGTLDLRRAVATLRQPKGDPTAIRILAGRNVILIHSDHAATLEAISAKTLPAAKTGRTDGVAWLHMTMPGDLDYKGMQYALALAGDGDWKAVSLLTSLDTKGADVRAAAIALAKRTLAEKPSDRIAAHERSWHGFWSRSGIALADRDMQRWWYRLLYFARTISCPGAAPPGLMPPLATDATPWHADFHFNYNSWQPFWSVVSANHPELADSWISYVHGLLPRAKWLAKVGFGCEGAFYSISQFLHEPDPAACKSKNRRQIHMNPWGLTIGMVGMTAQSLWHKHLCQPDAAYLKAKIYPTLREAARFYVEFMSQCRKSKDGKILLGPSYSPEHGRFGIANCPFDIAYVHYTFDAFRRAAEELGQDEKLAGQCRALKALLADYPIARDAAGKSVVVDWEGCKYKQVPVHNITVPASAVFPGEQITWFSPEPVKALHRRTIRDTRHNGNNSHVIFNIAKARLSMPEAVTDARAWFKSRELPNGLFAWQGHHHGTYMPESIGVVALITEFLMQSVGDTIRVFPCWPADKRAQFRDLRAQGGFLVSGEHAGGRVERVTVESTVGGRLRLLSPWRTIRVNGKRLALGADGIVELQTRAGQSFRFTR